MKLFQINKRFLLILLGLGLAFSWALYTALAQKRPQPVPQTKQQSSTQENATSVKQEPAPRQPADEDNKDVQAVDRTSETEVDVEIGSNSFTLQHIKVKKGAKIVWVNKDSTEHSVTIDNPNDVNQSIELEKMGQGQSDFITVDSAGTFAYHCGIHQEVQGTITVVE